ncbi:MAG: MBL fold metallo-hydrolase [Acidimicrobiia bacterium]|nr:MBL fold metallo-hydrolase [Acidimicrobiia bacterium]
MDVLSTTANNPSMFTGPGTNTYVVISAGRAAVIDPGPNSPDTVHRDHLANIVSLIGDASPVAVLVTHTHPDHAPAANPLGRQLSVPVYGFGPGPEFDPDFNLVDGEVVSVGESQIEAIHTPGHTPDHLCYRLGEVLFTGDHIMGGSTVIIEDAASYMDSLDRVRRLEMSRLYPGHGPVIDEPDEVIGAYIDHRRMREAQVVAALERGVGDIGGLVAEVYSDVDSSRHFAAAMQMRTMLTKLAADGLITWDPANADGEPIELIEGTSA